MDTREARQVLAEELSTYRGKSYSELVQIRGDSFTSEKTGLSGARYQVEVQVLWDARAGGAIRVIGSIDDGGWRAFIPLTETFIKAPGGEFGGE